VERVRLVGALGELVALGVPRALRAGSEERTLQPDVVLVG